MSHGRRTIDRRRRVLYSAHQLDQTPTTAASRREAERLREARCPPAAYGSRVHRRLQARWFSLVPVKRRTLVAVAGIFVALAAGLTSAHYASVAWPSIAYRPEIARPLRLDRADSFGRWFIVALLAASSGVSFLIYQLRRYRNDDFKGHYRLWRLVLVVMMLASLNALVSIMDWAGALLDLGFGKRVALTGSDWIRLVISFGGAVLSIRLVAEVRRCRFSLLTMIAACSMLAIPESAKWNVLQVDSLGRWTLVTSAPLLACTSIFISLTGYLRMLYREVQQIEDNDSLRDRLQQMRQRVFQRGAEEDDPETDEDAPPGKTRRPAANGPRRTSRPQEDAEELADDTDSEAPETERPKRRWFGLRRAKPEEGGAQTEDQEESGDDPAGKPPKKRRGFSMRLSPPKAEANSGEEPESETSTNDDEFEADEHAAQKPARRGWLRRKQKTEPPADQTQGVGEDPPASEPAEPEIDSEDIDWNSLSKSERRRLRKQLKRQKRAA